MARGISRRGFASMSAEDRHRIASRGGRASGGKFKAGDPRTAEAGRRGAAAQPIEAKRRGGENSHRGG